MNSWKLNRIFAVALTICALILVYNLVMLGLTKSKLEEIEIRQKALTAEVEHNTSWSSLLGTGFKSFFDGLTLGVFAEEGVFTEYNKAKRWEESVVQRDSQNRAEFEQCWRKYASAISGRNWFGVFTVIALIGYVATRQKKVIVEQHTT